MVPGLLAIQLLRCTEKMLTDFFAVLERILLRFGTPPGTPPGSPLWRSTEGYVVQLSEGRAGGFQKRTSRATGTSTVDHGCW